MRNLIFVLFSFLILSACQNQKQKELLTEKIQYDVQIKSPDPSYDPWIQNLEESKRTLFVKSMLEAAYEGRMRAYDYFNKTITVAELRQLGADTIYKSLTRSYPPYEEFDTIICTQLDYKDITKVRFLEKWYFDETNLSFEKKIIGLAPVLDKFDAAGNIIARQPLFWLYLDTDYPKK